MQIRRSAAVCAAVVLAVPLGLAAQPLGGEFQVNTYTVSRQMYPSASYDADGNFVVVWASNRGGMSAYEEIAGQRYTSSGGKLGTEFRVNTYSYATQNAPDVAAESNGDFVVVWRSRFQDADGYGIFGQRLTSAGAKVGTEFQVNEYTIGYQFNGQVASDDDGDIVVVWSSPGVDGDGDAALGQRYSSAGTPVGGNFQINTVTANGQSLPAVARDSDGDFIVAWSSRDQDGSNYGIFGRRYASSGAGIGSEFQINTYTLNDQFAPSAAAEKNGDFVVTWVSYYQEGSYSGVFGQRYTSSGAAIGSEFQVNTQTSSFQRFVSVGSDRKGGFVVSWAGTQQDGSGSGIFGQRFGDDGAALGGEFQINTYTDQNQERPAVAVANDGAFVVAWSSFDQDGSNLGIFAQRFAAPPVCPATPDLGCTTGFGKGLFLVKETVPGKEKLIAKLLKGPATAQTDLGNPLALGGTGYALCIYAGTAHATTLEVNRAGDTSCSGGATACWTPLGDAPPDGKGYKYKDEDLSANGVSQIQLKGGATKIIVKAKGPNLPLPIANAFSSATSVTLQVRGDDIPQCFGVTLSDIKKQETDSFKIK